MSKIGKRSRRIRVEKLLEIQGDRCIWCMRPMIDAPIDYREDCSLHMTLEHLTPLSLGGTHDLDNLALACFQCNNARGASCESFRPPWAVHQRVIRE